MSPTATRRFLVILADWNVASVVVDAANQEQAQKAARALANIDINAFKHLEGGMVVIQCEEIRS